MIDVMSASKDELIDYARNELGLNLRANASLATLRVKVAEAIGFELPDDPPAAQEVAAKPATVTINIHPTHGSSGRDAVFVSVNDKSFLIKRGVNVKVPVGVVEVLEHAVEDVFEYDDEAKDVVKRQTLSYPFTVVPD